jgi:hypothetical protein
LVDGTGRVFTNAVVIVEDGHVQSIASDNAPVPSGAENDRSFPIHGHSGLDESRPSRRRQNKKRRKTELSPPL